MPGGTTTSAETGPHISTAEDERTRALQRSPSHVSPDRE